MTRSDFEKDWIGRGLQLPNMHNHSTGGLNYNTGLERIHQSIYQILSTIPGERFFLPEFGSKLHTLLFEQNDEIFKDLAQVYIKEALGRWEPRIVVQDVDVVSEKLGNTVPIRITYRIVASNVVDNYVYPFAESIYQMGGSSS